MEGGVIEQVIRKLAELLTANELEKLAQVFLAKSAELMSVSQGPNDGKKFSSTEDTSRVLGNLVNLARPGIGWHTMLWISIMPMPVVIILSVGTKLQGIICRMAIDITERHAVIQGIPLVQVSDSYFWFAKQIFVLFLIHFTLFQNGFQIIYFLWILYEYGMDSCFNDSKEFVFARLCLGVVVQVLCSYVTLPLYALVSLMGSTMKQSIFDEQTSKALKNWRAGAKKKAPTSSKHGEGGGSPIKADGDAREERRRPSRMAIEYDRLHQDRSTD